MKLQNVAAERGGVLSEERFPPEAQEEAMAARPLLTSLHNLEQETRRLIVDLRAPACVARAKSALLKVSLGQ